MITSLLQSNSLFQDLPEDFFNRVQARFVQISFKLGQTILKSGQPGDGLFIIVSGKARVVDDQGKDKPVTLALLTRGDHFGERSVLYGEPAGSTVRAAGNLVLLKLPGEDFTDLVAAYPAWRQRIEDYIERYSQYNFLKTLNILADLAPAEARSLIDAMETVELAPGERLFHEGDMGDAAYIVRKGRLQVVKESTGNTVLAALSPGEIIGEMALLHSEPRSAGAVADGATTLLRLGQETFQQILAKSKKASAILSRQVGNRLLQQKAFASEAENGAARTARTIPHIAARRVTVGRRQYPFAQVPTPVLAGIACLAMIDAHFDRPADLREKIEDQVLADRPDTLMDLNRRIEARGYVTRRLKLHARDLTTMDLPAVAVTADGRFIVIYEASAKRVVLADPLAGIEEIPTQRFLDTWDGQLLTVAFVPDFAATGRFDAGLVKRFFPLVRPYWPLIGSIAAVSVAIQVFGLAAPLFSKVIIDKVLVQGDRSLLFLMLLGMLLVSGFQIASATLREFLVAHTLKRISANLLLRFFQHILALPQKYFSRWDAGDYTQRFQENENFLQLVSQSGLKVIVDSGTIVIYLVVMLSLNPKLTAISMIFVALYALTVIISTPMLRANDRKVFSLRSATQTFLIENIVGIETVKSLAAEDRFLRDGLGHMVATKKAEFEGGHLGFNIELIASLLSQANVVVILGYGAMLTLKGQMTAGDLVAFNAMIGMLLTPLMGLIGVWDEIQQIHISFERITDVLALPAEKSADLAAMPPIQGQVRLEGVCFRYADDKPEVLSGIDLTIQPGQKIALVGRSGSGKTSLLNLLIKLYEPTAGTIRIDGRDISRVEAASLRRQIGVVEQKPYLFNGTIRENIAKADPEADLEKVAAAGTLSGAHEFIKRLPMGYDTQIGERGIALSGGERQRLVIARAVLNNPGMLLLDEATAALDTESEAIIQKNLDELMATRTTVVIAHRLSTVINADKIVVLDQGRIVESGTHDELMQQGGVYQYLYQKTG